ncbi:MAG: MarR family transcriptional regulator [Alphaproteobacteria bacterium]|nr:MarR family transcriptional regulator [Alphaproteobacteria bacterium]MDE2493666.1 MarR family transcriptional regulator [Alphaproteobacteria bacterium]
MTRGTIGIANKKNLRSVPTVKLVALANFRHTLRKFLAFSERNARRLGLTPQRHQALLSIKAGYAGRTAITVRELAEHLLLEHHTTVELAGRLKMAGLIKKSTLNSDRRVVLLSLTARAERLLNMLSRDNLDALRHTSPVFIDLIHALNCAAVPRKRTHVKNARGGRR